jgi:hypothetical protein
VCGGWDPNGEFRKSGFKCNRCIGVPSNNRLKALYDQMVADPILPTQLVPVSIPHVTRAGLTPTHAAVVLDAQRRLTAAAESIAAIAQARREKSDSRDSSAASTEKNAAAGSGPGAQPAMANATPASVPIAVK